MDRTVAPVGNERAYVPDTVVTELADIEHMGGGMYRFTFTSAKGPICLVSTPPIVFRAATWALRVIGYHCCGDFVKDRCSLH